MTLDPFPLKRRSDLHLARKLWHVGGILTMVLIYQFIGHQLALKVMGVAALFGIAFDFSRLKFPRMNAFALKFFGIFMREHERESLAGSTYLFIGVLTLLWFFPRPIIILTLMFLAVADPLASYVGIRYGKDKLIGSKSLQGTLAAFFACTVIAAIYLGYNGLMTERILIVSLLSGLSGAVSELLPIGKLDDNLSFPVLSACLLWGLFTLFGGLI